VINALGLALFKRGTARAGAGAQAPPGSPERALLDESVSVLKNGLLKVDAANVMLTVTLHYNLCAAYNALKRVREASCNARRVLALAPEHPQRAGLARAASAASPTAAIHAAGSAAALAARCANCGLAPPKTSRCTRCSVASYCDRACQLAHWPSHKKACKAASKKAKAE